MSNEILERIHQILENLVRNFNLQQTYIDKDDQWTGVLAAAAFEILSTTSSQKCYSPGQLIFFRDKIHPIKHRVNWEFIRQQKQTQINKDKTHDNKYRVDYDYKVGDKVMLTNHTSYKYETPCKVPFVTTQCFTNVKVLLKCGAIKTRIIYNALSHINPILKLKTLIRKIWMMLSTYE